MGTKGKKPITAMEKRQKKLLEGAKKEKEKSVKKEESKKREVFLDRELIERARKELASIRAITPYVVKDKLGVSYSTAKQILRYLESERLISLYSSSRRIKIYVPLAT
ncbi:MAG: 30S ribosomal protein S25e [Sulfolobales archaeon]